MTKQPTYSDISDIIARKQEGGRDAARRSFGEKIAIVEALTDRLTPLKKVREERHAARSTHKEK